MERTAIELATASTRTGDPEEGLRAVAALRRRLEELEAWHVENAIHAGRSWGRVAQCLGVSKQAAHKKHAARLRSGRRTPLATAAREQGIVVTSEARRVVQHAVKEARRLGHARLGTGHLLLGLLAEEHAASIALARLGVTQPVVRRAIRAPETRAAPADGSPLPISPQGRSALEQSLREAVAREDRHLGTEHLLLALVRDERSDAARTLTRLGVPPPVVEVALRRTHREGRNVRPHA